MQSRALIRFYYSFFALCLVFQPLAAQCGITARSFFAYSPSVTVDADRQDFYDGLAYGGRLGFLSRVNEYFVFLGLSTQTANYVDMDPLEAKITMLGLGYRRYLVDNHRVFLETQGNLSLSDVFDTSFGASFGGGILFKLGAKMSFGTTTLYTFTFQSGANRRYLSQSLDLGFNF